MDPALETVLETPGILTKLAVEFGPRVMSAALLFLLFLLMALQNLGIELLPLVAGLGIAGVDGEVRAVSLFNTTLTHADLSSVVIPNRKIAGEILHNYGEINPALLATFRERGIEIPHPPGKSARAG